MSETPHDAPESTGPESPEPAAASVTESSESPGSPESPESPGSSGSHEAEPTMSPATEPAPAGTPASKDSTDTPSVRIVRPARANARPAAAGGGRAAGARSAAATAPSLDKAAVLWVVVEGRAWPAWAAGADGTAYVVSGGAEQPLPDLPARLPVILRTKDTHAAVGPLPATARRIDPFTPDWTAAVDALLAARQGAPHPELATTWATGSAVWALRLEPEAADEQHPDGDPALEARHDQAAQHPAYDTQCARPPVDTAATTDRWRPRHLTSLSKRRRNAR